MADFKISKDRVEDALNIIIQFLRDSGYEGSLEDGTGISDVLLKPAAVLREMFAQMLDRAKAYQSLQNAYELRDTIGEEEYDSAIDCILSNWFVTRNDGRPSHGLIRLWFMKPQEFMHLQDGQELGRIGNEIIVADGEQVGVESDFSYILNTAENKNEYYIDFTVRTKENSGYAPYATEDNQSGITWPGIYFLRCTIPQDFNSGYPVESSDNFIARAEQAITTRELITSRAINTVLRDRFSDIIHLYVARHGSSEQLRDIVYFQNVRVHVGNKADIYLATEPERQTITVEADENGEIAVSQLPSNVSAIDYLSAEDNEGNTLSLQIACDEKLWGSNSYLPDKISVNYTGAVKLSLLTTTLLQQAHDFVYSDTHRVACYDPLVRHKFIMSFTITISVLLKDRASDPEKAVKNAILEYMGYIVRNSQPWVESEVIASVHNRVANVKKILLPLEVKASIFDPLTRERHTMAVGNVFTIADDYTSPHSLQITGNTVQFYTDRNMITVISDYEG